MGYKPLNFRRDLLTRTALFLVEELGLTILTGFGKRFPILDSPQWAILSSYFGVFLPFLRPHLSPSTPLNPLKAYALNRGKNGVVSHPIIPGPSLPDSCGLPQFCHSGRRPSTRVCSLRPSPEFIEGRSEGSGLPGFFTPLRCVQNDASFRYPVGQK